MITEVLDAKNIWEKAKVHLKDDVLSVWLDTIEAVGFDDCRLRLVSARALAPQIVKQNYSKKICEVLTKIVGQECSFSIAYDADLDKEYEKNKKKEKQKEHSKPKNLVETTKDEENEKVSLDNLAQMRSSANLNLKYKFENFVVGENSEFTYGVAQQVAKNPATKYNPFFIYGSPGLGKTHIMQAIGHYIIFNNPKLKVKYLQAEEFCNDYIDALRVGEDKIKKMQKFRQKYRNVDVILIDDIQFIETRPKTMEEFFYTFNELSNKHKQIVVTSDRLPEEITSLDARLRSRFQMGVVTEITVPDFETRVAIVKNLAKTEQVDVPDDVCEFIADNFSTNVRELEGAYNKLRAYSEFTQKDISVELAVKILGQKKSDKSVSIEKVAEVTAKFFDVTVEDFKSPARNQKVSNARKIAVYLAREFTNQSFENIAEFFEKKHPTMIYSYDKVTHALKSNTALSNSIAEIKNRLQG